MFNIFSDNGFSNLTFYSQRTKKSCSFNRFKWNCDDAVSEFSELDWILQVGGNGTALCHRGI